MIIPETAVAEKNPTAKFTISKRQSEALKVLMESSPKPLRSKDKKTGLIKWAFQTLIEELLYGGAKGGGKSVLGCIWCYTFSKWLIKTFGLKPRAHPLVVGFMGRKQSVDFSQTTLNTWKRIIPADAYTLLEGKKLIVIEDTVAIQYGGLDDSETVAKFNSAEYVFFFIDQAEEVEERDMGLLRGTLRLKLPMEIDGVEVDVSPPYKGLLTANPAICWLKPAFILRPQPKTAFIKALPTDNPFLDEQYIPRLRKAFSFSPQLLKAYLEGSWDDLDVAFVVMREKDINACVGNKLKEPNTKRVTVSDLAEGGEDETVIYNFQDHNIDSETAEYYSHRDPMDTVGRICAHAIQNKSNMICVDKIGIGAGIYSRLLEIYAKNERMTIYGFDGRETPPGELNGKTFYNMRSYAWFLAADIVREKKCSIPDDSILKEQLGSAKWKFKNGKILVLPKEEQKELVGSSPDRADTFIMGMVALEKADPIRKRDAYAVNDKNRDDDGESISSDTEEFDPEAV